MKNTKGGKKFFLRQTISIAVGMFVFGFIDNVILVLAGDAIDNTIASTFGFSTMFSAGIGNTISDAVGVVAGGIIGTMVYKMFGEVKKEEVGTTFFVVSEVVGIVLGCLVGLFPLAFI